MTRVFVEWVCECSVGIWQPNNVTSSTSQRCFWCDVLTLWREWKVNINSETLPIHSMHQHSSTVRFVFYSPSLSLLILAIFSMLDVLAKSLWRQLYRNAPMSSESHNVISLKLLYIYFVLSLVNMYIVHRASSNLFHFLSFSISPSLSHKLFIFELRYKITYTLLFIHTCEFWTWKK